MTGTPERITRHGNEINVKINAQWVTMRLSPEAAAHLARLAAEITPHVRPPKSTAAKRAAIRQKAARDRARAQADPENPTRPALKVVG